MHPEKSFESFAFRISSLRLAIVTLPPVTLKNFHDDCHYLSARWSGRRSFTVVDPHFGLGEFFLHLWRHWQSDPRRCERLHVVSWVSQLPEQAQCCNSLQPGLPAELVDLSESLLARMPMNLPGVHRLEFEEARVTLTLFIGAKVSSLSQLTGRVDLLRSDLAWCSDAAEINSRLGRDLFPVAHKCESFAPGSVWNADEPASERLAIVVGAGFAGMGIAHALALRGWETRVFDEGWQTTHASHHGHIAAALTPQVSRDDNYRARLSRAGVLRALYRWRDAPASAILRCGALQLERTSGRIVDLSVLANELDCPTEWLRYVNAQEASELAGMPLDRGGLFFSLACRVQPEALLGFLAAETGAQVARARVTRIEYRQGLWHAFGQRMGFGAESTCLASAPKLILANSRAVGTLLDSCGYLSPTARIASLHALGGEATSLSSLSLQGGPACVIAGDGYVLPEVGGICVVGSTYLHDPDKVFHSREGARSNVERAAGLLAMPALSTNLDATGLSGWAGFRAVLPGRLPAIGPVVAASCPPGLWVAAAYASRGLTWSALAGDLISAAFEGEPLPLETELLQYLNPN